MDKLAISLNDVTFHASLLTEAAPRTIQALRRCTPFRSVMFSAKICNNEVTWNTPCWQPLELENPVLDETPGNIVFYPPWGCICVFYGPTEPAGECSKFAEFSAEERSRFADSVGGVWRSQGVSVHTDFIGGA